MSEYQKIRAQMAQAQQAQMAADRQAYLDIMADLNSGNFQPPSAPQSPPTDMGKLAGLAGDGLARGFLSGIPGLPGDLAGLVQTVQTLAGDKVREWTGIEPIQADPDSLLGQVQAISQATDPIALMAKYLPNSADVQEFLEPVIPWDKPEAETGLEAFVAGGSEAAGAMLSFPAAGALAAAGGASRGAQVARALSPANKADFAGGAAAGGVAANILHHDENAGGSALIAGLATHGGISALNTARQIAKEGAQAAIDPDIYAGMRQTAGDIKDALYPKSEQAVRKLAGKELRKNLEDVDQFSSRIDSVESGIEGYRPNLAALDDELPYLYDRLNSTGEIAGRRELRQRGIQNHQARVAHFQKMKDQGNVADLEGNVIAQHEDLRQARDGADRAKRGAEQSLEEVMAEIMARQQAARDNLDGKIRGDLSRAKDRRQARLEQARAESEARLSESAHQRDLTLSDNRDRYRQAAQMKKDYQRDLAERKVEIDRDRQGMVQNLKDRVARENARDQDELRMEAETSLRHDAAEGQLVDKLRRDHDRKLEISEKMYRRIDPVFPIPTYHLKKAAREAAQSLSAIDRGRVPAILSQIETYGKSVPYREMQNVAQSLGGAAGELTNPKHARLLTQVKDGAQKSLTFYDDLDISKDLANMPMGALKHVRGNAVEFGKQQSNRLRAANQFHHKKYGPYTRGPGWDLQHKDHQSQTNLNGYIRRKGENGAETQFDRLTKIATPEEVTPVILQRLYQQIGHQDQITVREVNRFMRDYSHILNRPEYADLKSEIGLLAAGQKINDTRKQNRQHLQQDFGFRQKQKGEVRKQAATDQTNAEIDMLTDTQHRLRDDAQRASRQHQDLQIRERKQVNDLAVRERAKGQRLAEQARMAQQKQRRGQIREQQQTKAAGKAAIAARQRDLDHAQDKIRAFEQSPAKRLMQGKNADDYMSDILTSQKSDGEIDGILNLIGDDDKAKAGLVTSIFHAFDRKTKDMQAGVGTNDSMMKNMTDTLDPFMDKLFTADQKKDLMALRDALKGEYHAVTAKGKAPGSPTAPRMQAEARSLGFQTWMITGNAPLSWAVQKIRGMTVEGLPEKVDHLLARALFDPDLAKDLLDSSKTRPPPGEGRARWQQARQNIEDHLRSHYGRHRFTATRAVAGQLGQNDSPRRKRQEKE